MTDEQLDPCDKVRQEYHRLIKLYSAALEAGDPNARVLFDEATDAWKNLRSFACEEARLDEDMHLVVALSFAVQARDAFEARRLYDSMGEKYRAATDTAESLKPGSLKIWVR